MEKDPAIWSRAFARQIGVLLGFFSASDAAPDEASIWKEVSTLLGEMTEDFRYLAAEKWNWVEHLSRFLRDQELAPRQVNSDQPALETFGLPTSRRLEILREVRSYVAFLRMIHGFEGPADESDEWTDEDRRDLASRWQ